LDAGRDTLKIGDIAKSMKKLLLPVIAICLSGNPLLAGSWFGSGPWANGTYYPGQLDGRYFANVYNNVGGTFSRVSTTNTFFTTNETTTTVISNTGTTFETNIVITNVVQGPFLATNTTVLGSVVSGVISFGIRDGVPAAGTQSTSASSSTAQSITVDPSLNNFLVYVNGDVYVGATSANINPDSSTVSGVLANGAGRTRYQLFTNQTPAAFGSAVANAGVEVISIPSASASGYFNANVNNIEELSAVREFMLQVPGEIEKLEGEIKLGMSVFKILEDFGF
jgi:hypothetical protein